MLTGKQFAEKIRGKVCLLDGATGTGLLAEGMPRTVCKEAWISEHPETVQMLQRRYAEAGSEILYAPTFQANPAALKRYGLENETELINARLTALTRAVAPGCLTAGNLTTMGMIRGEYSDALIREMTAAYRRQIRGLIDGGADLLAAETLLHPMEAAAVLEAAEREGAGAVLISFAMKPDGTLRSGHEASEAFIEAEKAGAAAVGMNCIPAEDTLVRLVGRMKEAVSIPLLVKPNAGRAIEGVYPVGPEAFADIMKGCVAGGADLIGGCCGTTPEYIAAIKKKIG